MTHRDRCNGVDSYEEFCRLGPVEPDEAVEYRGYFLEAWPQSWTVLRDEGGLVVAGDGFASERAARGFVDGEIERRESNESCD